MTAFREGEQALHRFDEWKQVPPLDEVHFQAFESMMTTLFRLLVCGQTKIDFVFGWGPFITIKYYLLWTLFASAHRVPCVDFIDLDYWTLRGLEGPPSGGAAAPCPINPSRKRE